MAGRCLLYYISDRRQFAGDESARRRALLDKIAEAAQGGVDYIQLREKDLSTGGLEQLARDAVGVLEQVRGGHLGVKTKLLINSRSDVALAAGADGVHLRSDDIPVSEARGIWMQAVGRCGRGVADRKLPVVAVSCHSRAEVVHAEKEGADFAVFAPVFEKKEAPGTAPIGLGALRAACEVKMPVLALGGVTLENARSCIEAGAAGIAAIRLFQENRISEVVRALGQSAYE